ncbi:beta-galactosidase GalB [Plebeiibacterium sediminum]|uniref:DUF4982 domain-containing protein n=1 Tax=Plebeiibacterium sediminum TaxID=2992112 RepID=A0AAE3M2G1_9BACT|nr:beta-galactosidase GalB [Plebeiobacterium sediminum]MCW3785977.1 DUF4982 domain-containing protein [Plebeiobacterium sediminum]
MYQHINKILIIVAVALLAACNQKVDNPRQVESFNKGWKFFLGDTADASKVSFNDADWRALNLPHDWSIEGEFSKDNPSTTEGGALPTGIGWYRKTFKVDSVPQNQKYYIDFDGVFCNSEVWLNGHYLGKRPFGYITFRYDMTPYLNFEDKENVMAVRVDNDAQPASRWYTGSGIYRNVWMVTINQVHVDHWGTYITTPKVSDEAAIVNLEVKIKNNQNAAQQLKVKTELYDQNNQVVAQDEKSVSCKDSLCSIAYDFTVNHPVLWSIENPYMYTAVTSVYNKKELIDQYETPFGIRYFEFDSAKGFFLNGQPLKIHGVNQHHDLGALGAAVNTRAMERQLEILKGMGCNAIRMAHNPPAQELLDLCDQMGFLVIDESFDEWKKTKAKKGYHLYWDEWHVRDLQDMILRDRNHPSIIAWSIGNEIREQFDTTGISITRELAGIVKELDKTRPVTSALTEQDPKKNNIYQSGALDLISFNYKHKEYLDFPKNYPGQKMLASENMSALSTRGHYDMPSDSMRIWPSAYNAPLVGANDDYTVSAYDHVYAYWGATHEDTWNVVKNNDFISGMFIWSGFDYLGEPIPYPWPARSSYLGIIDLAGFPKDAYYLYQSEWTDKTMLHIFPHWNWEKGQDIDVWAYYNNADEVELFLNGKSLGTRKKEDGKFHVMWRVPFEPGTLKAVSRTDGQVVLEKEIHTAGEPYKVELIADREVINADGTDLSFITVKIMDKDGNMIPDADQLVHFDIEGNGFIAGVDNGYQASLEPFKANYRKAFNGMCLLIVQATEEAGDIKITATTDGLKNGVLTLKSK